MEPRHKKIARIALEAAGNRGLALAGGYAVSAHGMGHRPSGDVDLFTDWQDRDDFPNVVATVSSALREQGFRVEVAIQGETFARLLVFQGENSDPDKVELAADWRTHPPVRLEIGPVLHRDDAVANKMGALFGRAVARDFLDIDAAVTRGGYAWDRLLELASEADSGFDPGMFGQALDALKQIPDKAFMRYGIAAEEIAEMRGRFARWRAQLPT